MLGLNKRFILTISLTIRIMSKPEKPSEERKIVMFIQKFSKLKIHDKIMAHAVEKLFDVRSMSILYL